MPLCPGCLNTCHQVSLASFEQLGWAARNNIMTVVPGHHSYIQAAIHWAPAVVQEHHLTESEDWVWHMHAWVLSCFSCVQLFAAPWTPRQAPLSMRFSRQEYWSGLPFPSQRDLPDPGIKPSSPALQVEYLPSEPLGNTSLAHDRLPKMQWNCGCRSP